MQNRAVTIKDIARILGLSKSTVSRALTEHTDVNPETRRRVLELAEMLDYQPNIVARNLKQRHTNTLGVIVPETMNRFFAKAVSGIQKVADREGYILTICQSNESYISEQNALKTLVAARVDGILVSLSMETIDESHFKAVQDKEVPVVFFDRISESMQSPGVVTNNYEIVYEATEHLIKQGCSRIAFFAGPQHLYNFRNRFHGYKDALMKNDLPVQEDYIVHLPLTNANVEEYIRFFMGLPQPPDAIFALNDFAALKIMYLLKKEGLRIPEDVAVMGFNNEDICPYLEPSLSSVDLTPFDLGATAAELLLEHIRKGGTLESERVIKGKLMVRESTRRSEKLVATPR